MKEDQRILASVTGEYTHLVRTPYGSAPNLTDQQKARLKQKALSTGIGQLTVLTGNIKAQNMYQKY